MKIDFKFNPQFIMIGIYWDTVTKVISVPTDYTMINGELGVTYVPRGIKVVEVTLCLLPMLTLKIKRVSNKYE